MNGLEAICFDYYGTLVKIGKPFDKLKKWFHEFLEKENAEVTVNKFNYEFSKNRAVILTSGVFYTGRIILEKSYLKTCKKFKIKPYLEEFNAFSENLFIAPVVFKDAHETIQKLRVSKKVGLLTNADNKILCQSLHKNDFDFDFIITSENAQCNKPDVYIFKKVLEELKLPADKLLMVGDSIFDDIIPAREVGFNSVWVNRGKKISFTNVNEVKQLKELINYMG